MEIWQAILLGFVQGFTEFLPVSSSGHLILIQNWFRVEQTVFYSVMLHIGTLIPVFIVFYKDILGLFKKPYDKLFCLILATIPAGLVGLILKLTVDLDLLFSDNLYLLSIAFIITAVALFLAERKGKSNSLLNPINSETAFIMGLGQCFGVLPGISRSGSVLTGGIIAKVEKGQNASFTFLMSIPIILSAVLLEGVNVIKGNLSGINLTALFFGIISAGISGYIAIKGMLKVIKRANYKWFSAYLLFIAIVNMVVYFI